MTEVPRAGGLLRALRAARGRAYPRVIGIVRDPTWVLWETILPLFGTVGFVLVYRALGAPERFVGYVIVGGAVSAFWMNVLWSMAAQFFWDKRGGNLEQYMIAPCGLVPILIGMSVGGIAMTLLRATAVVLIGSEVFGVRYRLPSLWALGGVFSVSLVALYGLGTAFAALFLLWGREAWHLANLFSEPVFLASGLYFPVRALGFWVAVVTSVIPLTLALDAMRQLLYPATHPALAPLGVEVGGLGALAVGFVLAARVLLTRMSHAARREGRLSLRY